MTVRNGGSLSSHFRTVKKTEESSDDEKKENAPIPSPPFRTWKNEYNQRLLDIYTQHSPSKLNRIGGLMKRYGSTLEGAHKLYERVCRKYEVTSVKNKYRNTDDEERAIYTGNALLALCEEPTKNVVLRVHVARECTVVVQGLGDFNTVTSNIEQLETFFGSPKRWIKVLSLFSFLLSLLLPFCICVHLFV